MADDTKHKVLIVDDDEAFTKLLQLRLKSFMPGMELTNFTKLAPAREFLQQIEKPDFDLVILDEHLPDGRGAEFLNEGWFQDLAVLAVSSDTDPDIPGATVQAGAMYFLNKSQVKEPLFRPLVLGLIDRNRIQRELAESRVQGAIIDTVRTLVSTLRHEINNPLSAVLGGAFMFRSTADPESNQAEAAAIVEKSGKRIQHVLEQLCQAIELEPVIKGQSKVFPIEGDQPWDDSKKEDDED